MMQNRGYFCTNLVRPHKLHGMPLHPNKEIDK